MANVETKILERARILKLAKDDPKAQAALLKQCEDFRFWVENFVWIYEPRGSEKKLPMSFEGWEFQLEAANKMLKCIETGKDLRIEKSRDMGISWLVLVVFTWGWLFKGWDFVIGSKNADSVDKLNNLKSLLPKVRFILKNLPKWMLPKGFSLDKHGMWMNIVNPVNGNSLSGEANSPTFATGTRAKAILFDEFAKWEHTDREAWTSAGAASPCRIAVSTPVYKNNKFYELKGTGIEELTIHYSSKQKDEQWLKEMKAKYTDQEWAQEMEIDYSGTAHAIVFAEELDFLRKNDRITEKATYIPGKTVYISADLGIGDATVLLCWQTVGWSEEVRLFESYQNSNKDLFHYIEWIKSPDRPWNSVNKIYTEGWRDVILIPDPNQASNRELTSGKSTEQILRDHGLEVETRWVGSREGISLAKKMLKKTYIHSNLLEVIDSIEGWHYDYDERRREYKPEPLHDRYSHVCKALIYFAAYIQPNVEQREEQDLVYIPDYSNSSSAGL